MKEIIIMLVVKLVGALRAPTNFTTNIIINLTSYKRIITNDTNRGAKILLVRIPNREPVFYKIKNLASINQRTKIAILLNSITSM